jgi:hypothetical protein
MLRAMHHGNACGCQDDLISIAQFNLDQQQNISSPQTEGNILLSLSLSVHISNKLCVAWVLPTVFVLACLVAGGVFGVLQC